MKIYQNLKGYIFAEQENTSIGHMILMKEIYLNDYNLKMQFSCEISLK